MTLYERASAAFFGALVGDAAGSVLEFLGRAPSTDEVEHALTLPGGGYWDTNPAQITDDGELQLALARSLACDGKFSIARVADAYHDWYRSGPFDLGQTINSAFDIGMRVPKGHARASRMRRQACDFSARSKANGSLMRCLPLAIWGHRLDARELAKISRMDSSLSHPNRACIDAVSAYVIALATLVRSGEQQLALDASAAWLRRHGLAEVTRWFDDAVGGAKCPYYPQAGFVRIAFEHAIRHLALGTSYLEAIRETLQGGGDTDTNACIVGGLLGASGGVPEGLRTEVQASRPTGRRARPMRFTAHDLPTLVQTLIDVAPESLVLDGGPGLLGKLRGLLG